MTPLNGFNFEVEEIKEDKSCCPANFGTRRVVSAHSSPRTPTYRTNGSDHLPSSKYPGNTICILSPEPPAVAHSRTPAAVHLNPPAAALHYINIMNIMDLALPMGFDAPILSPSPSSPLVLSSLPASSLVPSSPPEPAPPKRPPEPAPPELFLAYGPLNFPQRGGISPSFSNPDNY
ncbi:hypothetical protein M9458_012035 [Cirrhinus mrigala]|uniref:Uncharacterized protein n=1 Tax=Cirrhinus mrigala TaxID=683832 RepID=A0ABD0R5F3_CIRMR